MESVETTVRKLKPQPIATTTVRRLSSWRESLLNQIDRVERNRTANHPIDARLRSMRHFISEQLASITHIKGRSVRVEAGRFHWFPVRLLQRQEGMKALIDPGDPLNKDLDPSLRERIKAGWDAVPFTPAFDRLINRLHLRMVRGREQQRSKSTRNRTASRRIVKHQR
jgi:hypothetical protein